MVKTSKSDGKRDLDANGPARGRRLFKLIQSEKGFGIATMKAEMDKKTARKHRKQGELPSDPKRSIHGVPAKARLRRSGKISNPC